MRCAERAPGAIFPPSSSPARECTIETSSISSGVSGGRIEGSRAASIDLPDPGAPIISRLCPPAAAISSTRLALSWPLTSARSGCGPCAVSTFGFGRASVCSPLKWLTSDSRCGGASTVISASAHAASGPHAPGQISPLPIALAPMAAGNAPGTAPNRSVERQFADRGIAFDRVGRYRAHRHHHGERNRQVEMAAFLGKIGRRQVDGDVLERQAKADGMQGVAHPLAAFGDRLVGQADHGEHVPAAADAHLHLDRLGLDPYESDGRSAHTSRAPRVDAGTLLGRRRSGQCA